MYIPFFKHFIRMKYLLSLLLFSLLPGKLDAQAYYLQARVNGFEGTRAYLLQLKGDQQSISDSAVCLEGVFSFRFNDKTKPGIYQVLLGDKGKSNLFEKDPQFFDFIFNNENIILHTSFSSLVDSMKVMQSEENEIFYSFTRANESSQAKLSRIIPLFEIYKPGDKFYTALNDEFETIQDEFSLLSLQLEAKLPGSIAASVIQASRVPTVKESGTPGEMKGFIRDHYFDLKSFNDPRLLNSQLITNTIIDYLGLYRDPAINQSQQEDSFIIAVDQVMESFSSTPAIYDFVLNFLVDGFQRFQMEKVLVHIAENYIEGGCETDSKKLLQKRLEGYEKMAPGKKAPDILNFDPDGKQVRLYDVDRDYTLVLFWASWCPHCSVFLNQLEKWYPERPVDIEVFAVSIDSSRFAWEEKLMMENYPWINTFSGAGWDGKAPKDYNVYATPTLFLLDRDHRIIAKPLTFREFKREVDVLVIK